MSNFSDVSFCLFGLLTRLYKIQTKPTHINVKPPKSLDIVQTGQKSKKTTTNIEKKFLDNFLSNLGSISKNYSSKTKNNASPKFCTLFHNISKHFLAKFEENRRWCSLLKLTPNTKEKKIGQMVTLFFCPKIDVYLFFYFSTRQDLSKMHKHLHFG
jgi:hypothetical protein